MEIKLKSLAIRNFKGIKCFNLIINGKNAVIKAQNGVGKTTVQDAFYWLFFDKDSTGRKQFELRPLDKQNSPIKGLTLEVEAVLWIDKELHTFTKRHTENIVKNQLRGYASEYLVDEVPKKAGEYSAYIKELIAEDTFKLLTDLTHFNGKMHWTDRRKVLLDIAGEIGSPGGFEKLTDELNGRSIEDYKKVLAGQKKQHTKDRDEINPRIDELQKAHAEYVTDESNLGDERKQVQEKLDYFTKEVKALYSQEQDRQEKTEKLNKLEAQKITRAAELKSDTSAVQNYLDEISGLKQALSLRKDILANIESNKSIRQTEIKVVQDRVEVQTGITNEIIAEYKNHEKLSDSFETCSLCGQKMPTERLEIIEKDRKEKLAGIGKRGQESRALVNQYKAQERGLLTDLQGIKEAHAKALNDVQYKENANKDEISALQQKIDKNEGLPKEKDDVYQEICQQIIKLRGNIGEPVSEQLRQIETEREGFSKRLRELDQALAQADRRKQDQARIAELEQEEKDMSEKITAIEGKLAMIGDYKKAESALIESSVNKMFKHVTFKLFKQLLNGEIEDTCEAMLNGTPYSDMSTGEKIFVGIDIQNVLSSHYDLSVPLYIDRRESLTLPIEATCQTICLVADINEPELKVEVE